MGGGWGGGRMGVVIGVHSVQFVIAVGRLIVSRMVTLSNIDCLFKVTTITDLHLFLAEDCGYMPQKSILILRGIQKYWW